MSLTKMRRNMNKAIRPMMYLFSAVFFVSCFLLYIPQMQAPKANSSGPEPFIAKVNGQDVPRDIYERAVQLSLRQVEMRTQMPGQGKPGLRDYHLARGQGFEAVVDSLVRAQAAEKSGINVSNGEVREEIDSEIKAEMDQKMEGATPQERKQYESQLRSLADPETVRRRLLLDRLNDKLRQDFTPTEADMMNSYNEVKVRHILIKSTNRSDEEARKKAEELLVKARTGDFAALAKQYSEDTGSKSTGGDVGWITANSGFVPEFADAARKLKKGEVSPLVKTMFGYHILKADDRRTNLPKDIKNPKRKQELFDSFKEQSIQQRMQSYWGDLRLNAKMEPIDPWITGYVRENEAYGARNDQSQAEYQKLMAEAIKNYEKAAARNDLAVGPPLYFKLAELYNMTGQDDKALGAINKALSGTASAELHKMQGEVYERKKDKPNAVKAYQEVMKLAVNEPWLYLELQQNFKRLGREDLAKQAYDKFDAMKKSGKLNSTMPASSMPNLPFPTN